MQVQCVHCGKQYSLSDENAGSHFRCRGCRKLSPVSSNEAASEATSPPHRPTAAETTERILSVVCSRCSEPYRLRSSAAGKQFKCRRCGALTAVRPPKAAVARLQRAKPPANEELPVAEVVYAPDDPFTPLPAVSHDLFAQALPPASGYTPTPVPRTQTAPPPAPKVRAKKRQRRSSGDSDWGSRLVGGVLCMAIGVGVCLFAGYALKNYAGRWPARLFASGLCIIGLGFKVAIGRYSSD